MLESPGFAVSLVAESTTGALLSTELTGSPGDVPEDVGKAAALNLLREIYRGGCVDRISERFNLIWMIMSPQDVAKLSIGYSVANSENGGIEPRTTKLLNDIDTFFGIKFKTRADPQAATVTLVCVGSGFVNFGKKTT